MEYFYYVTFQESFWLYIFIRKSFGIISPLSYVYIAHACLRIIINFICTLHMKSVQIGFELFLNDLFRRTYDLFNFVVFESVGSSISIEKKNTLKLNKL